MRLRGSARDVCCGPDKNLARQARLW